MSGLLVVCKNVCEYNLQLGDIFGGGEGIWRKEVSFCIWSTKSLGV
jgi:hypothetical protein